MQVPITSSGITTNGVGYRMGPPPKKNSPLNFHNCVHNTTFTFYQFASEHQNMGVVVPRVTKDILNMGH